MLYLLGTVLISMRYGYGPSIAAAFLSVLCFNFFFTPPYYTFAVADPRHVVTFVVMFLVAVVISRLTKHVRDEADAARRFAEEAHCAETRAHSISVERREPSGARFRFTLPMRVMHPTLQASQVRDEGGVIVTARSAPRDRRPGSAAISKYAVAVRALRDTNAKSRFRQPASLEKLVTTSERGTEIAAIFYTLLETAKLQGLDPARTFATRRLG